MYNIDSHLVIYKMHDVNDICIKFPTKYLTVFRGAYFTSHYRLKIKFDFFVFHFN